MNDASAFEVTHTHNAGHVPVTVRATRLNWNYDGTAEHPNGCLEFVTPRVGDGADLHGAVPLSAVVRVERPDDAAQCVKAIGLARCPADADAVRADGLCRMHGREHDALVKR